MAVLRKQTKAGRNNRGGVRFLSGMKPSGKVSSVDEGGVVEYFFGEDGKKGLTLQQFQTFISELQEEVRCGVVEWDRFTDLFLILRRPGER
jgi:hypothetical protein